MQEEHPFIVLLITCMVAVVAHGYVRDYWRACWISAVCSVAAYAALVSFTDTGNKFFVSGMIIVGLFGYGLAMVVGIPFSKSRRGG